MKNKALILFILTLGFTFLFYQERIGLNLVIADVVFLIVSVIINRNLIKNSGWLITATGVIFSAAFLILHGSTLAIIANLISLGLNASFTNTNAISFFSRIMHSIFSLISSPVYFILDSVNEIFKKRESKGKIKWQKLWMGLIITALMLVFLFIYRNVSISFKELTDKFDLSFITWGLINFTLMMMLIVYATIYFKPIRFLAKKEESIGEDLRLEKRSSFGNDRFRLPLSSEYKFSLILLIGMNLLLLLVNSLDLKSIWIENSLPMEISFSDYVHQGVTTLIISLVLIILILAFIFRGRLNFIKTSPVISHLSLLWILQNIFLIASTAYRNLMYVNELGLTGKRIGVFVWLLLGVLGLITVIIKIYLKKKNMYILKLTGLLFFMVLISSTTVNWNSYITKFNLAKSKNPDINYLLELKNNRQDLLPWIIENDKIIPELYRPVSYDYYELKEHYFEFGGHSGSYQKDDPDYTDYQMQNLRNRLYKEYVEIMEYGWKSWNINRENEKSVYQEYFAKQKSFVLQLDNDDEVAFLLLFKDLDEFGLLENRIYLEVDTLELQNLPRPKYNLILKATFVSDIDDLKLSPSIKELHIIRNRGELYGLEKLSSLKKLEVLNLNFTNADPTGHFAYMPSLRNLNLGHIKLANLKLDTICPNLEILTFEWRDEYNYYNLTNSRKLKELNISKIDPNLLKLISDTLPSTVLKRIK